MKRCPECNRRYPEETQVFCLQDGARLIPETPAPSDPQANPAGASVPGPPPTIAYRPETVPQPAPAPTAPPLTPGQATQAPAARTSNLTLFLIGCGAVALIGVIAFVAIFILAIRSSDSNTNASSNSNTPNLASDSNGNGRVSGTVITSTDGQSQVTVPTGWSAQHELHESAELQAGDPAHSLYIIVLTDPKSNYSGMTLEEHAQSTLQVLTKNMSSTETKGPTRLTINGYPALQYELGGVMKNVKVAYLHTTVETPKNFQQIIAWTLQSQWGKNQKLLRDVVQTFKEVRR